MIMQAAFLESSVQKSSFYLSSWIFKNVFTFCVKCLFVYLAKYGKMEKMNESHKQKDL